MNALISSPAPHIHSGASGQRIMLDVILALLPVSIASVILFGLNALWVLVSCILGAVVSEFLFNLIAKKKQTIGDLSAVVTGLLLAFNREQILGLRRVLGKLRRGLAFALLQSPQLRVKRNHKVVD